jgi:hypothetical protein
VVIQLKSFRTSLMMNSLHMQMKTELFMQVLTSYYDKYRIKEGIEFDSSTGQFIDKTTEQIIPEEEAIELYR